ncbi:MAG: hypothetical protein QOE14_2442 [Humisphaera sp.]|nr:hypothetical protein [Humisphaera sp.]
MTIMKHMAAAVLYATLSLLGSTDNTTGPLDADGDDDAGVECVSYTPEQGERGSSLVLTAASRLCGQQIDDAWVIRHHHRPAAAAAVHQTQDHVAMVDLAVDAAGTGEDANVLVRALDRCREIDAIKIIVHAQGMDSAAVRALAETRGYRFSRAQRFAADTEQLEFYTDLYWTDSTNTSS